jgi:O-antigen/teichoic acid export membrane protein
MRRLGRSFASTSAQMTGDFFLMIGAQQATTFALPLVTSLATLGALKAAQVAVGPLTIMLTAATLLVLPSIAKFTAEGRPDRAMRRGAAVSAIAFAAGTVYALIAAIIPAHWGTSLFGQSWAVSPFLVVFVAVQAAAIGLIQGAVLVLRGTRNTGRSLIVRIWVTPLNVAVPLVGAFFGGTRGLGIGLVSSAFFAAAFWWRAAAQVGKDGTSGIVPDEGRPDGLSGGLRLRLLRLSRVAD